MNPEKQSAPTVKYSDFVGVPNPARTKVRIASWTSRVVPSPTRAHASDRTGLTADRSAQNIADWSTYLPADCVTAMVSLGWDHTT